MSKIINKLKYEKEKFRYWINDSVNKYCKRPLVYDIDKTLEVILSKRASISRFGDGEFDIIFRRDQPFQKYDKKLRKRLKQILKANDKFENFFVGIPDCYGDLSQFTEEAQNHWCIRLKKERLKWYRILNRKYPYYQAQMSRFYLDWKDKNKSILWAQKLKEIWKGRDLIIVEGEKSRLGVTNDLFSQSKSVKRILCPSVNAFEYYDGILNAIKVFAQKDDLILLALGPTASVLAYDLYKLGFQAIDIGHVDIEYEWMMMGAQKKERIPGRFMNEIDEGKFVDDSVITEQYIKEIIKKVE